jgi:hypothetical protein
VFALKNEYLDVARSERITPIESLAELKNVFG